MSLERLEDRTVPSVYPTTDVGFPYGPLVNGLSDAADNLPLPWTLDAIDDEGWVWVNPDAQNNPALRYRDVTGVVVNTADSSIVNNHDFPALHDSHDQNTQIQVDAFDPINSGVVSVANESSGHLTDHRISDDPIPDEIEMEWEMGIGTGETSGDGTKGLKRNPDSPAGPIFPKWAWPNAGDRIWVNGQLVYDAGHPDKVHQIINENVYRSEIHPARAIASMRDQVMPLPGTGGVPVRATATDLYIHGDGGIVNDELNCGTGFVGGDDPNFRCPGGDRTPIDEDYRFDIHLPPRPFPDALLSVEILAGPGNTVTNPALEPRLDQDLGHLDAFGHPDPVIHVKIPLSGSGVDPLDVYARHINAGWQSEVTGLRHLRLTLNSMDLHNSKDDADQGYLYLRPADASFFWLNVPAAPAQEWSRLSDFDVPTPSSRRVVTIIDDHTIQIDCDTGYFNVMQDYAPDDTHCGPGELGFQGLAIDVYLRPASPFIVRALGYEQDDMDALFGIHRYSLASYAPSFFGTGYADAFSTLDARIAFQTDAVNLSYFGGDGKHLADETLSDTAFPDAFQIDGLKLQTDDYDLYFTLEGVPLTAEERNDPPSAEANGPYTVNEGSTVALSSAGSSDPDGSILRYEWDFNYDGVHFDVDATGASPNFSAALLDGPSTRTVAVRVYDNLGATAIDTATVTILNVPPSAAVGGDDVGVPGLARTFAVSATDPAPADVAAGFTFHVGFGDGSTLVIHPGEPLSFSHVYTATGNYTVAVTATDKDGGTSLAATHLIAIRPAAVLPDPDNPGCDILYVGGSLSGDHMQVVPNGNSALTAIVNGSSEGPFPLTCRIVIFGLDGDDNIELSNSISVPAEVHAGKGNDQVGGGAGDDILLGEAGDDQLAGGGGRDLMIGGIGSDQLLGGGDDDLLIGGTTDFDAKTAALLAIMREWTRTDVSGTYEQRIDHLLNGGGWNTLDGGITFVLLNTQTVHEDDAVDVLKGVSGRDWFFAHRIGSNKDKIFGVDGNELVEDL